MAIHDHDPAEVFPTVGHLPASRRTKAALQLVAQLDAAVDARHARGKVDLERAEMLLDLLQTPCPHCDKAMGTHLGVNVPGTRASGARRRTTAAVMAAGTAGASGVNAADGLTAKSDPEPHPASYLHNLWHLLWG